jgi:mannose-6-phosphate isomerase-like protein (cupin superfamily)
MKYGKVWGTTEPLIETPLIEFHRITIKPNMQCSLHKHTQKWNAFYVVKGVLQIVVFKNDYDLEDTTNLGPGDFTTVKPGEFHLFKSNEMHVEAFELYYPSALSEDIIRKTVGGAIEI